MNTNVPALYSIYHLLAYSLDLSLILFEKVIWMTLKHHGPNVNCVTYIKIKIFKYKSPCLGFPVLHPCWYLHRSFNAGSRGSWYLSEQVWSLQSGLQRVCNSTSQSLSATWELQCSQGSEEVERMVPARSMFIWPEADGEPPELWLNALGWSLLGTPLQGVAPQEWSLWTPAV